MFGTFILASFLALVAAQNIPSPLNNMNTWMLGNDATIQATGATTASVTIGTTSGTLTFDGDGPSLTGTGQEYWGRLVVQVSIFTVNMGMCVRISPVTGSTSVSGLTYRSNETTIQGITANVVSGPGNPTTQAVACNAGTLMRPDYERSAVDLTSGSFTPVTCPSAMQYAFTNYSAMPVGAAWTCGLTNDTASGVTSGQLMFNTGTCGAASTYFGSSTTMYCLHSFTRGSVDYVNFANATSAPMDFYCAAYTSPSAGQLDMTIVKDMCDFGQTASSPGGAATALSLKLTYTPTGGNNAGSQVVNSIVVLATCLAAALHKLL